MTWLAIVIIVATASFAVIIASIVVATVIAFFASQDSIIKEQLIDQQRHCFAIIITRQHVEHNEF